MLALSRSIKLNELLAKHTIKNEIRQLLSKHKYSSAIDEHEKKQQKEGTTQICYPLFSKITLKKFEYKCCSSKLIYLLHLEKYKATVQKQ